MNDGDLLEGAGPADPAGRLAPPPDVLIAIALAVEECWPRRPAPSAELPAWNRSGSSWRFSGRWWADPVPRRRARPGS